MIARPIAARIFGPLPPPCVGLLGGSFNPAHDGHRHIAELALKRLALDEVWWMVSPQNPLKPDRDMASLAARQASARRHAAHPRMRVTSIENALQTRYTADTLTALRRRFPRIRFVWLMGADNLAQMERWERWSLIFHTMPIAVFARLPYSTKALASKAARRFSRLRRPPRHAARLARDDLPAWVFLHTRLHPASASAIRRARSPGRVRRTT